MDNIIQKFKNSPIIPVLTFDDINSSLQICQILIENNLTNLEVTLRTANSLRCIEAIKKEFSDVCIGAGTILQTKQLQQVKDVGCSFAVSPGFTKKLIKKSKQINMPYLPGVSSPSQIMQLSQLGIKFQKFFHAKNSGGANMLKAYSSIFKDIKFCPTGGISQDDYKDFLQLDNVLCLGGSWLVSQKDIKEKNYQNIKKLVLQLGDIQKYVK
jgi:2-dehydro-3-deoxyphosphogluconate aldolase/(4S)-4-hydroxy-2-oxoglutarate aldolase